MTDWQHEHALIVVDVQRGFDDPIWGRRGNPDCEDNIATLIAKWRERRWMTIHVRHDSVLAESPLSPTSGGNALKSEVVGEPELLVVKQTNSAFYGKPDLHELLQAKGIEAIAICGITTNHCCETTARMAGNLGYDTKFIIDATCTFDRRGLDGQSISAEDLMRVTAANLNDEFATVFSTEQVLQKLAGASEGVCAI